MIDYFDIFQSKIEKKYGKEIKEKAITLIFQLSIELKSQNDEDFKQKVLNKVKQFKKEYSLLENREEFLIFQANEKKKIEKQIKKIDRIINNKELLLEEYEKRNEKLPLEKKIFSVRVLKNNLKEERKNLLERIKEYNKMMKPSVFLEKKKNLEQKLTYMDTLSNIEEKNIFKKEIELQKEIIKCMHFKLKNAEEKNDVINIIYQYRYFNFLPVTSNKNISEIRSLEKNLDNLTKDLIDKAISMKIINKILEDEENYNITKKLFLSKIIKLEDINIKPSIQDDNINLTIFDEEIEDIKIKLSNITKDKLNIKFNKKTKLFI